ncbi:MAG: RidA family protein [Gemmatimonadaceae bacterium]
MSNSGAGKSRGRSAKSSPGVIHPDGWAPPVGYVNGIAVTGRTLFVSGQIGWNPLTRRVESDDFVEQTRRALENIAAILRAGGATPAHVTRLTWFITEKDAYVSSRQELGAAYRSVFGAHFPAMSVVFVAALLEDRAKVEIEATAVIPLES